MKRLENYKILILVPVAILILSVGLIFNQYIQTGDWFKKSIELKGGTLVTINTPEKIDVNYLEARLKGISSDISVREIRSFKGYGTLVEAAPEIKINQIINELKKFGIEDSQISIESIGSSLGSSFWSQAQIAIVIAFIAMGIIVFFVFKTFVPSLAVILSALSDIIVAIALMQIFNIELSLAGLAALLMLIGYSVDTDIMLTTRLLKEGGEINERLKKALKTGLTMTLTTIGAVTALLISSISPVLTQIATVLLFGLMADLMNTWLQNAGILKWYAEKRCR